MHGDVHHYIHAAAPAGGQKIVLGGPIFLDATPVGASDYAVGTIVTFDQVTGQFQPITLQGGGAVFPTVVGDAGDYVMFAAATPVAPAPPPYEGHAAEIFDLFLGA